MGRLRIHPAGNQQRPSASRRSYDSGTDGLKSKIRLVPTRYSEFCFKVNGLLVLGETLGSAIRFERDGSRIEIRFRIDDWAFLRATGTSATEKQSNGAISIRGINVLVFECTVSALEGGLSESADRKSVV